MKKPIVGIIMGSQSDFEVMKAAGFIMKECDIPYEMKIVSAHRTPDRMREYAKSAKERGIEVIIAGAGGAAHLPGMVASMTSLPVIGVPVKLKSLEGIDSLLSIVQMPGGIPVATVGINNAKNAGILAARIVSLIHKEIDQNLTLYTEKMKNNVGFDLEETLEESWREENGNTV